MCGFAGFWISEKLLDYNSVLSNMLDKIAHRGKDNRGVYINQTENPQGTICLGHNRLSIIDLTNSSNQPYFYKHFILLYNGEIYNFNDIKLELINLGYSFISHSDTEVIIKLFDCFGFDGFARLNGMFSIFIYDKIQNTLHLVRDRLGVKPLYYYYDHNTFLFASELKSFFEFPDFCKNLEIDKSSLTNYFKFGYVNTFNSIFKGVKKVENGSVLTYNLCRQDITSSKFWELEKVNNNQITNFNSALEELFPLLKSAISLRLVSDVPVGLFLSSGIDSNLVLSLSLDSGLDKLNTFTLRSVDYEDNGLSYDSRVSRKFISSSTKETWEDFKFLCSMYDEPFSDPATIGLYQLSKSASSYNKVILVGDGGDELLAGYNPYKTISRMNSNNMKVNAIRFFYQIFSPLVNNYIYSTIDKSLSLRMSYYHSLLSTHDALNFQIKAEGLYNGFAEKISGEEVYDSLPRRNGTNDLLDLLNYQTSTSLIHQLNYKTDIAGMLNTVEIREPLLDYRLFEFQQRFSSGFLNKMVSNQEAKILFRTIMSEKLEIDLKQMQKKGFHINLETAFRENIEELDNFILNHKSENINMDYVRNLWSGWKNNRTHFIIINRVISFIYWESNLNRIKQIP